MTDDLLYETVNGQRYYKGLSTDTVADHKDKCDACRGLPDHCMVMHGQAVTIPKEIIQSVINMTGQHRN